MEHFKKYGKTSFAKHLRNKNSLWTKRMANSKSRAAIKRMIKKGVRNNRLLYIH
jgi:hypothetical protein